MKKYIIMLLTTVVALTSCVSQHEVSRKYSTPFRPDVVRLDMTMDDYEYLGQVTVEVEYKTYLGIFKKMVSINGEPYTPRSYRLSQLNLYPSANYTAFRKALYKVTDEYPMADYIVPASRSKHVEHMVGGRIIKEQMTVKVFAIRNGQTSSAGR